MIKFSRFVSAAAISLGFLSTTPSPAAEFELVGREVVRMMQNGHYARLPFNENLSARFLERYLSTFDGEKTYFLKTEVADFKRQYERNLHNHISTKSVMPIVEEIFEIYKSRVTAQVAYVHELLEKNEFDFTGDRSTKRDRAQAGWPADAVALQKVWSEKLEDTLLSEFVRRERLRARATEAGKPDPFRKERSPEEKVGLRYNRLLRTLEKTTEEDIADYFFSAVTTSYDPHSEYLSANEMEQFKIDVSNELVGIGARLSMNDNGETEIHGIVNGGPADSQGELQLGDRVIAVSRGNDGQWFDIMFKPIEKVIEHILGQEGELVGIRLKRKIDGKDQTIEIAIPRGVVTMKDDLSTAKIYEYGVGEKLTKLAVIRIPSFYFDFDNNGHRVSVDVERILKRLNKEEVDGIALDLRDNTGGSLPEVQRLTGFFIHRGPIVQVKGISGQIGELNSFHRKPLYDDPLVLLTNKGSASATEILAGALQDYNRAVIVGSSTTYGKGTVQKTLNISEFMPIISDRMRAGWLKLTFQKYYRVTGSSVQIKGVTPDLILPSLSDAYEMGEGYKKYALPHDVIRRSSGFKPRDRQHLFITHLQDKSGKRVNQDPYFKYLLEDISRAKDEVQKNSVSLNREVRMSELKENEVRRKIRTAEREERYAAMEDDDKKTFKIFRLTLDDLDAELLPLFDGEDRSDDYIREAADEVADLEKTLKWPSGVDAVKREGLYVLRDLVAATRAGRLAGIIK
ncbi:MAG: carboxy terminal-processing peptidase [Verrucomicrobiales bacterium]